MGNVAAEVLRQVLDHRANGADSGGATVQAEAIEARDFKMLADGANLRGR
jgi:hypothetical protein